MNQNRFARTIIVAILVTLLFGALGAINSQVSAQQEDWQLYRIEASRDGTLYYEYRAAGNWQMLVRGDGQRIYSTVFATWTWSAISEMVVDPSAGRLSFFSFEDLSGGTELVYPVFVTIGEYSVWEEPFVNGDFLVRSEDIQTWFHYQVNNSSFISRPLGEIDPISIEFNELGFVFFDTQVGVYDAITSEVQAAQDWPMYYEVFETTGLGGKPDYDISHYQTVVQSNRWQFVTGLVNDRLAAGVLYNDGIIDYWLGSTVDPMEARHLATLRGDNLVVAIHDSILECQFEMYGANCTQLPSPLDQ